MWPSPAVVILAIALAGPVPSGGPDLATMLTSAPFGAAGGQAVVHTVVVTGTGTGSVGGVRLTFSTNVDLERLAASTTQGRCTVADARTVACELDAVDAANADAPPRVTISGTVAPGTPTGTLVQNVVRLTSDPADADPADNEASNAYVIPDGSGPPSSPSPSVAPQARPASDVPRRVAQAAGGLIMLGGFVALVLVRRRRSRIGL